MRITVEDAGMVNWEAVTEALESDCKAALTRVIREAQESLKDLKPGSRKTLSVRVGSITVSRPR